MPKTDADKMPDSIRFSPELKKEIREAAKKVGLQYADTIRQAIKLGLPILVRKLNSGPVYE